MSYWNDEASFRYDAKGLDYDETFGKYNSWYVFSTKGSYEAFVRS